MASNVESSGTKLWPELAVKSLLEIMVDEATKGNIPNGMFHRIWNSITTRLNSLTNHSYNSSQVNQKMLRLRTRYHVYESWRNDPRTLEIAARLQRKLGVIDHYELLRAIFNRSTVTGVLHHSSNQDPPNTNEENELESQYLNAGSHVDVDNDSSDDDIQELVHTTHRGKRSSQLNDPKSKKKCRSNDMGEALLACAEASKANPENYKVRSMEVISSRMSNYSITKCVTALEEIIDIPDDFYMKALEKFREPDWREMFLAMSSYRRRAWLFTI